MRQLVLPVLLSGSLLPTVALAQTPATPSHSHQARRGHLGTVTGHVVLADGQPANHVSVMVKGTTHGTTPDAEGNFTLEAPTGWQVITVTGLGYSAQETSVEVRRDETVSMPALTLERGHRQLDEVTVTGSNIINRPATASKADIAPLDLPQSIGVVTSTVIADQQVNRLGDALRNVSGVSLTQQRGGVAETFSARGYSIGIAGSGGSIFKNGLLANTQGFPDASTLESVEVLKGAAALLYGNVSGGLIINTVTKKPRYNWGGSVEMRAGSYSFYKPIVDVYGPLTKNLAFRVVGTYEDAKSFRDVVRSKRLYVNPSLLYKFGEKTDLLVQGDYLRSDITPDAGIGILNQNQEARLPTNISRSNFINAQWAYNVTDQASASAVLNHRFSDQWRFNAIVGLMDTRVHGFGVGVPNGTIAANGDWNRSLSAVQTAERDYNGQVNLNGKFGTGPLTHQLLVGADALRIVTNNATTFGYRNANGAFSPTLGYDLINIIDRSKYTERTDVPEYTATAVTTAPSYRFGGYVQDLITIVPMLKVLGGVRYSYQNVIQTTILNTQTGVETRGTAADKADRAWSPKGAVIFQPLTTLSIYASYANNFITNAGTTDTNGTPLAPSHVDQYEAGVKSELFHSGMFVNATVYRYRNSNFAQPVLVNGNATAFRELTGETTSDGVDVDFSGSFSKNFYFNAGYAYNFMRYTNTSGVVGGQIEGERLTNNPAHTANGSIFYTFDRPGLRGLKVGASAFYTGQRLGGNNNTVLDPITLQPTLANGSPNPRYVPYYSRLISLSGFTTIDLSVGYTYQRFSILAKVSNITNELNYLVHDRYSINPIPPRQFLTTVGYRF
jgi:iron complex outermembrane receptor protein